MRRFEVWRSGETGARLCLREISVPDSEGPREAAVEYAHCRRPIIATRSTVPATGAAVQIRGTKTSLAARQVPLLELTAPLVAWSLARAPGAAGRLFLAWANVRRDLARACADIGIAPVSPNDLRRSLATWLRAAGVEPSLLALVLGHADGRMVERVYGRLSGDALRVALERRLGTK